MFNYEGLIPVIGGFLILLVSAGVIPRNPKNPQQLELWRQKFGPVVNFLAPLVILFGLLQFIRVF